MNPHYVRIALGEPLPSIRQYAPFKAVLALDGEYPKDWQDEVCDWLVASGCRYAITWGQDCERWHDSIDHADMRARNYEEDDTRFVMTTWHENETLESAFWFAQFCAEFSIDEVELKKAILVDVSLAGHQAEYMALWEQAKTLAEREDDED